MLRRVFQLHVSFGPGEAYMFVIKLVTIGSGNGLSPVQMFTAKPLPGPMVTKNQSDIYAQILVTLGQKYQNFLPRKYRWKCRLQNGDHFVQVSMWQD